MNAPKPEQQIQELIKSGAAIEIVDAPIFTSSTFRLSVNPTECSLSFQRTRPAQVVKDGNILADLGKVEAVCVVQMSPAALKDLYLLIGEHLANYEKEWGELHTEYTRHRART